MADSDARHVEELPHQLTPDAYQQRIADRTLWPRVAGGCHAARDTGAAIERAGFEIERVRRFPFRTSVVEVLVTPHILGVARRATGEAS